MEGHLKTHSKLTTRKIAIVGMLSAISIFLGITGLGFIPIPPVKATIMHIPVIIGAIIEGPIVGGFIGLAFGLFSMYQAFTAPGPTSFIFWNPIIALLPRILIGVVSYYSYVALIKISKKNTSLSSITLISLLSFMVYLALKPFLPISIRAIITLVVFSALAISVVKFKGNNKHQILTIGTASILGTLTNTALVLGLTYIFYVERFANAIKVSPDIAGKVIWGIGVTNGIPEAIISALIAVPVVLAVKKIRK